MFVTTSIDIFDVIYITTLVTILFEINKDL
jgi:hypothetical protein